MVHMNVMAEAQRPSQAAVVMVGICLPFPPKFHLLGELERGLYLLG